MNIYNYSLFEAKSKQNWLEITQSKLKDFKKMVDENPVMRDWNNNDVMSELVTNLKDIAGDTFPIWYEEWVKFTCGDDYLNTQLTKNGEIRKDFGVYTSMGDIQNPYKTYTKITGWLDKKRLSGKEIEAYYVVDFETRLYRTNNKEFIESDRFTQWEEEVENTKEFLESLGFEVDIDFCTNYSTPYRIRATIKLEKTEQAKKKTLDLSDLVPDNIVDDFERFIMKRGLTRSDAEEISKIFIKK
jgi:hypothetical protein